MKTNSRYIYDVLNSNDNEENKMVLDINYKSNINMSLHQIDIYMSASVMNNPMIKFLHDLLEHKHLIRRYKLNIHYAIGQCSKCRVKNFMHKEKGCLSGGRYCIIDTAYRQNGLVKETLRQICIRKQYNSETVIKYLWALKQDIAKDKDIGKWNSKNLEMYSWNAIGGKKLDTEAVRKCFNDSFTLIGSDGK
jgi:hypothetical protein